MTKDEFLGRKPTIVSKELPLLGGLVFFRPFNAKTLIKYYELVEQAERHYAEIVFLVVGGSLCDSEGNRWLTTDEEWEKFRDKYQLHELLTAMPTCNDVNKLLVKVETKPDA